MATDTGDILLLYAQCEFKMPIKGASLEGVSINCLCYWSKGFIAGGDGGTVWFFERSDDPKTPFADAKKLSIANVLDQRVVSVSLCPAPSESFLYVELTGSSCIISQCMRWIERHKNRHLDSLCMNFL